MNTKSLRGAAQLAAEATAGLADLVEAMHARIAPWPVQGRAPDDRTSGITGLVYRTVRGVTRVAGGTVDALLGAVAAAWPATAAAEGSAAREGETLRAVLNGVLGDHLAASGNPLAIAMALRHQGQALPLDRDALAARVPAARPTLVLGLHGLCMNDLLWQREGQDHVAALAGALGATPLYLHYNSGLPIVENGRQFAGLMQRLLQAWPQPVQRVVLLTHSMGGLVARRALQQALADDQDWPSRVSDLVFLGTPHHGAPLERAGHGVDRLLEGLPYPLSHAAPLARLGRLRSAGITDLRHGLSVPLHAAVPLPTGPRCWAVAATLGEGHGALQGRLLGDGLVPVDSALGRHRDPRRALGIPLAQQAVVRDTGHLALLSSPAVAAQLRQWLAPMPAGPAALRDDAFSAPG